jgi:Zn-dependent peptidase ImmA (M78 family)
MKTERMTILISRQQKSAILSMAHKLGLSAGELVRQAVASYPTNKDHSEHEAELNALADELLGAAQGTRRAIDEATAELQITLQQLAKRRETSRVSL